jgi:autotransporter-associated beta strand protein
MKTKLLIILTLCLTTIIHAYAGSATWNLNPGSGDWNTAANWTPATVPNGLTDVATFALSNTTAVSLSGSVQASLVFNSGASAYTITVPSIEVLTINSPGIANNSGVMQEFVLDKGSGAGGLIQFNSGTAGNLIHFDILGVDHTLTSSSRIDFLNSSNAGTASFDVEPSEIRNTDAGHLNFHNSASASSATIRLHANTTSKHGIPADLSFYDSSTAGSATITVDGGKVKNGFGNAIFFSTSSKAGASVITLNGAEVSGALPGMVQFITSASPDGATIIANAGIGAGGTIRFFSTTTISSTAHMMLLGNGALDLSGDSANSSGLTISTLDGDGPVFLGSKNLSVGNLNLDCTHAGIIQDGGFVGGVGGTLTKVGTGALTLRGKNRYTGLTTVSAGTLIIANRDGSATGSGAVKVNTGRIGGNGTITGGLTIGTGTGTGATLIPRLTAGQMIILTVGGSLTFNSDATYNDSFSSVQGTADNVTANGVTINSARLLLKDRQTTTLPAGTVFTLINNTAATPIAGTFANLADGATVTIGSNNFQVSYEGGDGNDLTLTVVQ